MKKNVKKLLTAGMVFSLLLPSLSGDFVEAAGWEQNSVGWWWQEDDASYPADTWKYIGGQWYYFDNAGYMLDEGWHWIGGKCYYMYAGGAMAADTWIGGSYVDASGAWVEDVQAQWMQEGGRWWYRHADGSYPADNWEQIHGSWYHFDSAGWMQTGWIEVGGKWYYLHPSGVMASNSWIGNYYLGSDGAMLVNTWTPDGYYVGSNGEYVENTDNGTDDSTNQGLSSNWKEEMLALINEERAKAGVPALKLYEPVNGTAQIKAEDLKATGVFSHDSENLGDFSDQYDRIGLFYDCGGENIAYGYFDTQSVMKSWMQSSGHRNNILSIDYTHVGLGFCDGYWVQQFVGSPDMGETMDCIYCGGKVRVDKEYFTSTDAEGNIYNVYQCRNCIKLNEKCPKCETGFFQEAGISAIGSIASKCNVCGHNQSKTCIVNCPSCNEKILHNSRYVDYKITFDSTQTYDGTDYKREEGCYFQQIKITNIVCNSCGKNAIPSFTDNYSSAFEKLQDNLEKSHTDYDIFDYITWEKVLRYEISHSEGNTDYLRPIYKYVGTPRVTSLDELTGKKEV